MPLPTKIAGRQAKFDAAPELLKRGDWVCLNIETSCDWPVRPQSLTFAGHYIWIIPITVEDYPGVAIKRPGQMSPEDAERLLYRFLSVLAWQHECGISVSYQSGGNLPYMIAVNKRYGFSIRDQFDFTDLICPEEEGACVALALMREGRSLNHYGYAFLTFWRVLELAYPLSKERTAWINATFLNLNDQQAKEAHEHIAAEGVKDVGRHLFESGRCAVAHGTSNPIINPDDPRDERRLARELPLVRELATRAIEEQFGILTSHTEYQQHHYELRGWKTVLGAGLIGRVLAGQGDNLNEAVDLPEIHVRLRGCSPYSPMEGMIVAAMKIIGERIYFTYQSSDELFRIEFSLNLIDERLEFDMQQGFFGRDDGSVRAAEYRREVSRFIRDFLLNGELQIWHAGTGVLLSRKDAFIPRNSLVNLDGCNANIASAQSEVERRLAASNG